MKTCIYAVCKNEDYIEEWIEYHLNLGFDYIILGDNNDIGNELKLSNYNDKLIIVPLNGIPCRVKHGDQNDLYNNHLMINQLKDKNIDYCCVIDLDEFVELKEYNNIKDFIKCYMVSNNHLIVSIRWETYDDNNIIYKKDETNSVLNDYKHNLIKQNLNHLWDKNDELSFTKSIFSTKVLFENDLKISSHCLINNMYNTFLGQLCNIHIISINHFRTKCLERYLYNKCLLNQTSKEPFTNNGEKILIQYFNFNKITKEKLFAAIELCHKYNIKLSPIDIKFLNEQIYNFK
jgi:hypothetical protein